MGFSKAMKISTLTAWAHAVFFGKVDKVAEIKLESIGFLLVIFLNSVFLNFMSKLASQRIRDQSKKVHFKGKTFDGDIIL